MAVKYPGSFSLPDSIKQGNHRLDSKLTKGRVQQSLDLRVCDSMVMCLLSVCKVPRHSPQDLRACDSVVTQLLRPKHPLYLVSCPCT